MVNDDLNNLFCIDLNNKAIGATTDILFISSFINNNESAKLEHCKKIGIRNIWEYGSVLNFGETPKSK